MSLPFTPWVRAATLLGATGACAPAAASMPGVHVAEHLLWFVRFAEGRSPTVALNAEVEPDRARLDARLREGAARWAPLIASFSPGRWDGTLDYTTMRGTAASLPFAATLAHVFNHGTHHRGQITAALTALGQPSPELDLVYFLQNPSQP